jgi:hypothetical protein
MRHVSTEGTRPIAQRLATRMLFFTEIESTWTHSALQPFPLLSRDLSQNPTKRAK